MKTYKCNRCREDWEFFPKDYKYNQKHYPTICPLCEMTVGQMIRDVYVVEGLRGVIRRLWIRIIR